MEDKSSAAMDVAPPDIEKTADGTRRLRIGLVGSDWSGETKRTSKEMICVRNKTRSKIIS